MCRWGRGRGRLLCLLRRRPGLGEDQLVGKNGDGGGAYEEGADVGAFDFRGGDWSLHFWIVEASLLGSHGEDLLLPALAVTLDMFGSNVKTVSSIVWCLRHSRRL